VYAEDAPTSSDDPSSPYLPPTFGPPRACSTVVLGSALVPFWDERFSGGLSTALFLELPTQGNLHGSARGQQARPDMPCPVRATLA
jgi:hypothetical protein